MNGYYRVFAQSTRRLWNAISLYAHRILYSVIWKSLWETDECHLRSLYQRIFWSPSTYIWYLRILTARPPETGATVIRSRGHNARRIRSVRLNEFNRKMKTSLKRDLSFSSLTLIITTHTHTHIRCYYINKKFFKIL